MNERIVAIAQELARSDRTLTLDGLAGEYEVSSRTIRNDVKSINLFLAEKGMEQLEYGPGGAIVVPPDFSRVLASLPVQGFYSYKLSSEERKTLAVVIMALEPGYVTLAAIADRFSVSRATVLNDLDGIKAVARDAGLEVISRPNRGLKVVGDETALRGFLLNFVLTKPALAEQWAAVSAGKVGQADEVTIDKILNEQCRLHKAVLDDRSFGIVRRYLQIAVQRCRDGMRMKGDWVVPSERQEALSFARDVISLLAQYCGVGMGEGEAENLSLVLETSGFRSDAEFTIEDVQVQTVTRRFVQNVSLACGVDLNGDYSLFECLSNHLETMFSSDASRFPVNPVLREVVTDQPQVLDAVKDNLPILEAYSRRRITEVETIYVALHICAALERRKNRERRLRVVVVCDEGVGTSRLVVEDLRGRFDIRVIKVIPAHEAPYLESYRADLVISTVALNECPVDNVVALLPFSDRDYERMREKIDEVRSLSDGFQDGYDELGAQGLLDKIEPILRRELTGGGERVIREIRTEVRRYFHEAQHMEEEILTPYLHQLLPPSHIQLDVEASDWRDAIAKSARPLVEMGYIEPRYIDAMIQNVVDHGPYVVLVPHFAIPHEAPEKGTYKMGMNLIRLRTPVKFDADDHDPVEFVCTLAPTDHKSHLKAFFNLLSMLTKPELSIFQELRDARTPEEAAAAIETAEYQIIQ
ncbi:PTS sugar transporter subunit IIA [Olsenella uli]|uniref:BglG family transcription antiterminator n=1 Tax=Olsenella uli TaxID=133926 RepID=UPI00195E7CAC|nr:PTS sugar transporter subunit IIA [Olsenella uli]MBM6676918.1 PTS sugar transporter subunit IIA [Olsenella uli]